MKFSVAAFVALLFTAVQAQTTPTDPSINTPVSVVTCQPAAITFTGTAAPFTISIIPGNQVGAAALETIGTPAAAGSLTWNVNIAAGTSITFQIRDAQGRLGYSAAVTVQAGTSTTCVGTSASAPVVSVPPATSGSATPATSPSASPSSSLSISPAATTTPATAPPPAPVTTHPTTATHAATSAPSPSPSPPPNAGTVNGIQWGIAALSGAFVAAVLA